MTVQIRRPRAIVFDILGTASKSGFLERILFPFLKVNLENYINNHWAKKEFKVLFNRILQQSNEFNKQEPTTPLVMDYALPGSKASLMNFINFVTENGINSPAVTHLRFKVWFEGYQQSKLKTPIYSDVPNQIKKWFSEGIKFYVFSNTWTEAQKALLRNTNHGDLTNLISGHYDNDFGSLLEVESWQRLCNDIKESPDNVLFLTKAPNEARAASDAGLNVVLVLTHRHNVKAVSHDDRNRFPYVRTLNDLAWVEQSEANVGSTNEPSGAINVANTTPVVDSQVPPTAMSTASASGQRLPSLTSGHSTSVARTSQAGGASATGQPPHSSTATQGAASSGAAHSGRSGTSRTSVSAAPTSSTRRKG